MYTKKKIVKYDFKAIMIEIIYHRYELYIKQLQQKNFLYKKFTAKKKKLKVRNTKILKKQPHILPYTANLKNSLKKTFPTYILSQHLCSNPILF